MNRKDNNTQFLCKINNNDQQIMLSELARLFGIGRSCTPYAAAIMLALDEKVVSSSRFMDKNVFAVISPMTSTTVGYGNPCFCEDCGRTSQTGVF